MIDAAGFVLQDRQSRRILILRRTDGRWDLPGGRAEPGDVRPLHTAWRELEEETGYPGPLELLDDDGTVVYEAPVDPRSPRRKYAIYYSRDDAPLGAGARYVVYRALVDVAFTPRLDGEHDAHDWITEDEAAWHRRSITDAPGSSDRPMHEGTAFVLLMFFAKFG